MRTVLRTLVGVAILATVACSSGQKSDTPAAAPTPDARPLAGLAAQKIVITPTFALRIAPKLDWEGAVGRREAALRQLDADIAETLAARGLRTRWVFPADLVHSFHLNPTYATDPYDLAEQPLRSPSFEVGSPLPEPLASQLRTISALHDGRFILAPVELRLERASDSGTAGRAVLRLMVLDSRLSQARWIGEAKSDTTSTYGPALLANVATKFANMIIAPDAGN